MKNLILIKTNMKEIKLSDLRIGNWVQNNFGTEYQVKAEHILMNHQQGGFFDRPIPITEEWLLRFGFVKTNKSYFEKDGLGFITGYTNDGDLVCTNTFGARHIHFYYVNEIQNIWYFVTGEELTINN